MISFGWGEILLIFIIVIIVVGPKDIPKFLGYIGRLIGKNRSMTSDYRETVDDAIKYWKGIFDQTPFEYITLIWHFAQQPKDEVLEEMQLFMEKVVPELEVPDYPASSQ